MKKLILLATVCLAFGIQKTNAQVSFNLSISSGPAYGYYEPAYYAHPVVYTRPVVYHRPVVHRRPVVYHVPARVYVAPRPAYYRYKKGPKHFRNYEPGRGFKAAGFRHGGKGPHHMKHRR